MEGKVWVQVCSTAVVEGQKDILRESGKGRLDREENGWRLRYVAHNEAGEKSQFDIHLHSGEAAIRNCLGGYTMYLRPGQITRAPVATAYGTIELCLQGRSLSWMLEGKETGEVQFEYTLLSNGQEISHMTVAIQLSKE